MSEDLVVVDDPSGDGAAPQPSPARRRLDRGLLLASAVIAGGIVLIVWGMLTAVTGDDGIDRPDPIEALSPVENAVQVLQQDRFVVDLQFGYEAVLVIDGVELPTTTLGQIEVEPGAQITLPPTAVFDPGSSVISFQPTEGALIEELAEGRHEAEVIYWRTVDGRAEARTYRWSFDVI